MKRSAMTAIIANWVHENFPDEYDKQTSAGNRIDAEGLLERLEKAGMIPPTSIQKSVMPGVPDFTVNEWEKE